MMSMPGFSFRSLLSSSQLPTLARLHRRSFTCSSASSSAEHPPSSDKPPVSESSISDKLLTRFPDAEVRVEDVSGGCGSFFVVQVIDKSFHGLSTLKQHQLINRTLAEEIDIIHGLQIQTRSPPS
ncbi:hypothetical protein MJO29_015428 [Puccinia striiformis f. sp. tritici]|uniref:hypothetical protein n=1 Tax=Puccinia striiformis f. sp. tritici TaxID=168172 RepID=UPI00200839DA|nr:hypothetical protein Pst134EA_029007 [Puccinia striiformis f. sp. tritici]KAH9447022.1 hypothetical protein Pst134EA_029007 [Puccinia striiformis f. sp. tritici]KAI7936125.1 hypothetical protein MJO29_015428 [Puccinia striiformis f. sp. tritici]